MSFVSLATQAVTDAAKTLTGIGSEMSAAAAVAAAPTTGIAAAAQDEVSAAIAGLFSDFGQEFRAVNGRAQASYEQFIGNLNNGVGRYAAAEVANLQALIPPVVSLPLPGAAVSLQAFEYPTPLGPVSVTLYGQQTIPPLVNITSGTLQAPLPLVLAYDTLSPFANAFIELREGGTAFNTALQAGNTTGALTALFQTPGNAVSGFLFGGNDITGQVLIPPYTGYAAVDYHIPVPGLLSPVQPVSLTLYGSSGTVTHLPLSGPRFGGPFAGIVDLFSQLAAGTR